MFTEREKMRFLYDNLESVDIFRGVNYDETYIHQIDEETKTDDNSYELNYKVTSQSSNFKNYNVKVVCDRKNYSMYWHCDCPRFNKANSCKHVAAVIYNFSDDIMIGSTPDAKNKFFSNELFNYFEQDEDIDKETNIKGAIKKELKMEVHLIRYYDEMEVTIKLGLDQLYILKGRKLNDIGELYTENTNKDYVVGKKFTYNPTKTYLNNDNKEIFEYIIDELKVDNYYYSSIHYKIKNKKYLIKLVKMCLDKNVPIFIDSDKILKISHEFPLDCKLTIKSNNYHLKVNDEYFTKIFNNQVLIQNNTMYVLNKKQNDFINIINTEEFDEIVFDEGKKTSFINNILPIIRDNIIIDENVDIKLSKCITPKLYFDLYREMITCKIMFDYDKVEIGLFEKNNSILRDTEYENEILNEILSYGFSLSEDKLYMDDIDIMGNFFENILPTLPEKYETFTSEKFKDRSNIKKSTITSTFSIGQDNIMSYSFDLGEINKDELSNIMLSLKNKKKYYKLKNGDLLNIGDNDDLLELQELQDELDLSNNDIKNGGTIPKYRAIYLDSVKNDKYHIIKTNNLFDDLINKFKTYKDSKIKFNKKEKEILRDYQLTGVKWLYNIDKSGFGGILADEMGLGKSIQTIYYIKKLLEEDKNYKFLIVVPTSLAYNWENEFQKFAKEIPISIVVGVRNERRKIFDNLDKYNVLITTYGLLREDFAYYEELTFKTMIIDEAQTIKNPTANMTRTCKKIKSETKIALTGTPVENNVSELWSIFDFIMPGFLHKLDKFNSKYKIKDFDEETNKKISNLNKLVSPFILRRKKKDVVKELPDKNENNIYIDMSEGQKKVYHAELVNVQERVKELMEAGEITKVRFEMLRLLTKLRQICIDPKIVIDGYKEKSGKMEQLVEIVKELVNNNRKTLIFTSFRTALEIAHKKLEKENITSYTIDGSVKPKERMKLVNKFNNDDTNVFFIMIKAGGNGLNLTSADAVIHLDLWWNPQVENQATDRAHRIGQKNTVDVIRLITKGTIEEKILELQNKKKLLAEKLIDEGNTSDAFDKLTEEDIKNLLSIENEED